VPIRQLLFALLLALSLTARAEDEEDFDVTEEGKVFDHSRTGLLYRRKLYIEGDEVTRVPNYPTSYNDTRDTRAWKIYVSHWEQDPPSFITVWMQDDSTFMYSKAEIDLRVTIGHYDRDSNMVPANQVIVRGIPLEKGINRVPININNYKGDIVWVHLIGVRQKIPITAVEVVEDE
jgi:hypothetical protein